MNNRIIINFAIAVILTLAASFTLHIYLVKLIGPIISHSMQGTKIIQMPYGTGITIIAYLTALLPAIGMVIMYHLIGGHLPGNKISKGITFALLFSLASDSLLRMPIMNFVIGNTLGVVILQQIQSLLPILVTGIIIAYIVPYRKAEKYYDRTPNS